MHIGIARRRGAVLATSAVGIAAASIAFAVPASASSLDTHAALGEFNAARAKLGCASLSIDSDLNTAAQAHSADMAKTNNVSSKGSDRSTPDSRIADAGYSATKTGEVQLATPARATSLDFAKAVTGGNVKTTIADCTFTQVGFGLQAGPNNKSYWTVDLAKPA